MTVVSGSLSLVTSHPAEVSQVWVRARDTRTNGSDVVVADNAHVEVKNGAVRMELLPGPAVMVLTHHGRTTRTIPLMVTGDTQTLANAVELGQATDGKNTAELQGLLDRIAAEVAGATDGSVGEAKRAEESAKKSAADAQLSAGEAKASAESVAGAVDAVSEHAGSAKASASAAKTSEDNAKKSADAAKASAQDAAKSAGAANTSETNAQGHASEAARHEVAAKGHADDAAASAARAGEIATSTSWDGDRLTVNGKTSPSLRGPKGDPGADGTMTFDDLTPAQRAKLTPEVKDGVWWVGGVSTGVKAQGEPGPAGTVSGFTISDNGAISIGDTQGRNRDSSVSIGEGSGADTYGVTVGYGASGSGEKSVTVGYGVISSGDESVAVGPESEVTGEHGTAVGRRASASGESAVAVGDEADAEGEYSVAIGRASHVTGAGSAAIGPMHTVHADGETHVGLNSAAAASLSVRDPKVVLHGRAESTEPASRPEHLINKGYVDAVKADVETKATVKMVSAPPSVFEPNVLYVIPEDGGRA